MPLILGAFFGWWARGAVFTISQYGLAVVIALVAIVAFLSRPVRSSWPRSLFVGTLAASLIPAHIVVMLVGGVGVAVVWAIRTLAQLARKRTILPSRPSGAGPWRVRRSSALRPSFGDMDRPRDRRHRVRRPASRRSAASGQNPLSRRRSPAGSSSRSPSPCGSSDEIRPPHVAAPRRGDRRCRRSGRVGREVAGLQTTSTCSRRRSSSSARRSRSLPRPS